MAQWESGIGDACHQSAYPVLDFEDVQYIIDEEEEGDLLVLARSLEGKEELIGYSYAYQEGWESTIDLPALPCLASPRQRRGQRATDQSRKFCHATRQSLYIAEIFVSENERGLGLGDLLLTETLKAHVDSDLRSHLFVSSKNVSAVRCYSKFGFVRGLRPSGDLVHDQVMELNSCQQSVMLSIHRYAEQLDAGTVGVRRRRRNIESPLQNLSSLSKTLVFPLATTVIKSKLRGRDAEALSSASKESDMIASNLPRKASFHSIPGSDLDKTAGISPLLPVSHQNHQNVRATRAASKRGDFHSASQTTKFLSEKENNLECISDLRGVSLALFDCAAQPSTHGLSSSSHSMLRRSSRRPRFHLTGMRSSARKLAAEGIRRLGGDVLVTDNYDFSCTHVVATRPMRTEKFLCGLAEGKPLLHPAYIEESLKNGAFLSETEYEWCSILADAQKRRIVRFAMPTLDPFSVALAKSGPIWRKLRSESSSRASSPETNPDGRERSHDGAMCYEGVVAMLFVSSSKTAGLGNLILAGGGLVATDLQSWRSSKKPANLQSLKLTHALVCPSLLEDGADSQPGWTPEERADAISALTALHASGVRCLRETYAADLLLDGPGLSDEGYLLAFGAPSAQRKRRQPASPGARSGRNPRLRLR
jgi:ribosomal protein S18 acetylase RimI-like enzyme